MKKVCVIGGGIFGVTTALELSKFFDVTVFEKASDILQSASTNNHLRHHYGYHYPRSKKTALESIQAREGFNQEYGDCVSESFPAYYAISKNNSKTTTQQFIDFCAALSLPLAEEKPSEKLFNTAKIDACFRVPEPVYSPKKLTEIAWAKLKKSTVKMKLGHEVVAGEIRGNQKIVKTVHNKKTAEGGFDAVVSVIYTEFNDISKWFNLPRKKFLYERVELLALQMPSKEKFGLTIIDGEFSSVLPREGDGIFTLGHVKESVLKEMVSDDALKESEKGTESNRDGIMREGISDFPILAKAKVVGSIFVNRIVKAGVDDTDERPTEITSHGNGIYSIFGGKVITCVDTARKLREMLVEEHIAHF